jgi:hypothetical protein
MEWEELLQGGNGKSHTAHQLQPLRGVHRGRHPCATRVAADTVISTRGKAGSRPGAVTPHPHPVPGIRSTLLTSSSSSAVCWPLNTCHADIPLLLLLDGRQDIITHERERTTRAPATQHGWLHTVHQSMNSTSAKLQTARVSFQQCGLLTWWCIW